MTAAFPTFLNAAADMASSVETVSLTRKFDFIYGAVGVHPMRWPK